MQAYKLIIPFSLPGLNEYINACRRNAYIGAKMKRDTDMLVCSEIRKQMRGVKVTPPVVIDYLWVTKDRRKDCDNVSFGKKFIQDALHKTGVLDNDSRKYIAGFTDAFAVDKVNPRVEVTIRKAE